MSERWGFLLPRSYSYDREFTWSARRILNMGLLTSQLIRWGIHAGRGKLGRPEATTLPTAPLTAFPKQGCNTEASHCPHPQLQTLGLYFAWEEKQAIKTELQISSQRNLLLLWQNERISNLGTHSRSMEAMINSSWEDTGRLIRLTS